uniref:Ubiquitin-like domain-containing protein n=1 Tax=Globisporangium ultimum (strain ATCC 200006 / CBS 805.95 / DAOM BR144) TaxID=431595 RepID=K3WSP1_GLOUD
MQLFVRTSGGRTLVLAVDYSTTVGEVMALAQSKEIDGNAQYSYRRGAKVNLEGFQAAASTFFAFASNDADENDFECSSAVEFLKSTAAGSISRYLHYGGVPLRPQRALYEYGIQNHATLELSTRMRGGCFGVSITLWIIIFICCVVSICTCGLSLAVAACLLPFALLLPLCCL